MMNEAASHNQVFPETLFYIYLFLAGFAHLVFYVPNLAAAFLVGTAVVSAFYAPSRLRLSIIPFLLVASLFLIDFVFHEIDIKTIKYYLFWSLLFAVCSVLQDDPRFFNRAKVILLLYLFCHFVFLAPDPEDRLGLREDLNLVISNPNDLAYWCGFGIFAGLVFFINLKGWMLRILALTVAFASTLVLLGTVSMSALLTVTTGAFCYLFLTLRNRRMLAAALVAFICIFAGLWGLKDIFLQDVGRYEKRIELEKNTGYRFSGRVANLEAALDVFFHSPLVGTGQNLVNPEYERPNTPHNAFLALAVHYGMVPAILLAILWFIIIRKTIAFLHHNRDGPMEPLSYELGSFILFLFLITNMSNQIVLEPFSVLYMTKILTVEDDHPGEASGYERKA